VTAIRVPVLVSYFQTQAHLLFLLSERHESLYKNYLSSVTRPKLQAVTTSILLAKNLHSPVILSSIPPSLRGVRFSQADDSSFQHRIIHSWQHISRQIVSLNTGDELMNNTDHHSALLQNEIDVLTAPSSIVPGFAYLPSVKESLLLAAKLFPDRLLIILNADIKIVNWSNLLASLRALGNNQSMISHRLDVATFEPSDPSSSPYLGGYDFFACNSKLLAAAANLLPGTLTFALPWWDLYLGLALSLCSDNLILGDPGNLKHLIHSDRWDFDNWHLIGRSGRREFADTLRRHTKLVSTKQIAAIYALVARHPRARFSSSHLKRRIKSLLLHKRWRPIVLHEISDEIISHIRSSSIPA